MNTSDSQPSLTPPAAAGSASQSPGWRTTRRILLAVAGLMALIAGFYTAENWLGRRAWENCRRELEAKGARLDWEAYIPAPVPDEQNIFKAPKMTEWFVGRGANEFSKRIRSLDSAWRQNPNATPLTLAELRVVVSDAAASSAPADAVLQLEDPAARGEAAKLLRDAMGPAAIGSLGLTFISRPLDQIKPVRLEVRAETAPTLNQVRDLFPDNPATSSRWAGLSRLRVESVGSNTFLARLSPPPWPAADYLAWSDQFAADFDLIRKGLERPYARMEGDYRQPFAIPNPNFVALRMVAQALANRTQCYLALGQPEAALRELTLLHDSCRLLEAKPSGQPMTLVAAMINVAITALYATTVGDGLHLQAWREPQLAAIQQQLREINLLVPFVESFESERAAVCRTLQTVTPSEFSASLGFGKASLWERIKNPRWRFLALAPRGWVYQNMATMAFADGRLLESVDLTNGLVWPRQADDLCREMQTAYWHSSPYTFLAASVVPNYLKASQTLARNQTWVNQARVACALERYRLAHNEYPATLAALVPQFIDRVPPDIIGGQPLKYRRTEGGGYLLYSVGWDEKDHGGVPGKTPGKIDEEGDWVWEYQAR